MVMCDSGYGLARPGFSEVNHGEWRRFAEVDDCSDRIISLTDVVRDVGVRDVIFYSASRRGNTSRCGQNVAAPKQNVMLGLARLV